METKINTEGLRSEIVVAVEMGTEIVGLGVGIGSGLGCQRKASPPPIL